MGGSATRGKGGVSEREAWGGRWGMRHEQCQIPRGHGGYCPIFNYLFIKINDYDMIYYANEKYSVNSYIKYSSFMFMLFLLMRIAIGTVHLTLIDI